MRSPKLGVAVVGLGVGKQHARAYLATGRCRLRWLYDWDRTKAQALAEELGEGEVATCWEQILEDPQVQIVSLASYDDAHGAQVVSALEAGKHVFVEKPLCLTRRELGTIKRAWAKREGKLKLSSNLVLRMAPLYRWLKEQISGGEFGTLYAFDGEYLFGRLSKITQGWRKDVKNYSVILGGGVHLVDLLVWLTGGRPRRVFALGNRICSRHSAFCYPDFMAATLEFPSGLVGRVVANFGCVHRHQHGVRIFGTRATFLYDDAGPRLHQTRDPAVSPTPIPLSPLPVGKGELIPSFVRAVLADGDPQPQTQEVFDVISICLACSEALEAESFVEVCYL